MMNLRILTYYVLLCDGLSNKIPIKSTKARLQRVSMRKSLRGLNSSAKCCNCLYKCETSNSAALFTSCHPHGKNPLKLSATGSDNNVPQLDLIIAAIFQAEERHVKGNADRGDQESDPLDCCSFCHHHNTNHVCCF